MADKKVKIYQVFFQDEREKKIKNDITEFFAELHDAFLKNQINLPQLYNDRKVYLFDYALHY